MTISEKRPNLLTIGGSDPSSGAGIQSDIRVFSFLGANPFSVITAITSQNTQGFFAVQKTSPKLVESQLDAILSDFAIDAIKISMVYDEKTIRTTYQKIRNLQIPIIIDPVVKSTTGGTLLQEKAIHEYRKILKLATIITPNLEEAKIISNAKKNLSVLEISKKISKLGPRNVVITGIREGNRVKDFVYQKEKSYYISGEFIDNTNHGSGCNYSAALTYALAKNNSIRNAARFAKDFAFQSIKESKKIGSGIVITSPIDPVIGNLTKSVFDFGRIKKAYTLIPECQTNFVFAKSNPKSRNEIAGINGRIVKAEKKIIIAGQIKYGGSKHVASAVLEVAKKFPSIRSAINIKYSKETLDIFKKSNFNVLSYDRKMEPKKTKSKENSSVSWGTAKAIESSKTPPDAIYHKGDFGKESMIIIFGETPEIVLRKLNLIT